MSIGLPLGTAPSNLTMPFKEAVACPCAGAGKPLVRRSRPKRSAYCLITDHHPCGYERWRCGVVEFTLFLGIGLGGDFRFAPRNAPFLAERMDVVHYVPHLIGFHGVRERRHRCAIQSRQQVAEYRFIGISALEAHAAGEIKGRDRIAVAVGEARRGRPVASPLLSVAGPTVHALKQRRTTLDALRRGGRPGRNGQSRGWLLLPEGWGKGLDISNQIYPVLPQQRSPRRHSAGMDPAADGVVEILIERQASAGCRPALELCLGEVARPRAQVGGAFSPSVSVPSVTEHAIALIERLAMPWIPDELAHARLLREHCRSKRTGEKSNANRNCSRFVHCTLS